jgi:hypothetical protein
MRDSTALNEPKLQPFLSHFRFQLGEQHPNLVQGLLLLIFQGIYLLIPRSDFAL